MNYLIGEALEKGLCRAIDSTDWELVHHPAVYGTTLRTYALNRPLVLHCSPQTKALRFLRHAWSGSVAVTINGETITETLSLEDGIEFATIPVPQQNGVFQIQVESVPVEGRAQDRCEVWLTGLHYADEALALSRSISLNRGTKIVYGDWGEFLALASDEVIPDAIAREGSWAPGDIELFKQHISSGDVVLDVGANIGHHSVVFSKLVGREGLVIAIEAQRLMYQLVNANLMLNRCDNAIAVRAAAGAERGSVTMCPISNDHCDNFGALGIDTRHEYDGGEEVQCYRLDALIPEYSRGRKVDFVKVDVQSYELFVLQGMIRILEQDRPTIFIEISPVWMRHAGYEFTEIYALLKSHGYDMIHREGTVLNSDGIPDIAPGLDVEWDVLAVHPERR